MQVAEGSYWDRVNRGGVRADGPVPVPGTPEGKVEEKFPSNYPLGYPSKPCGEVNPCGGPGKGFTPTKKMSVTKPGVELSNFFLPLELDEPLFREEEFPSLSPPTSNPARDKMSKVWVLGENQKELNTTTTSSKEMKSSQPEDRCQQHGTAAGPRPPAHVPASSSGEAQPKRSRKQAPAMCRGWGWAMLRGGAPPPTRAQQMVTAAREKLEKEREKERDEKEANQMDNREKAKDRVKIWVDNLPMEEEFDELFSESLSYIDTVPPPSSPSPQQEDCQKELDTTTTTSHEMKSSQVENRCQQYGTAAGPRPQAHVPASSSGEAQQSPRDRPRLSDQIKNTYSSCKEAPTSQGDDNAGMGLRKRSVAEEIFDFSDHEDESYHPPMKVHIVEKMNLDSPNSSRASVIHKTPTKPKGQPTLCTPDHQGEALREAHHGAVGQAEETEFEQAEETLTRVSVSKGSTQGSNVFFIGVEGQTAWNHALLTNYFVLAPPHQAVCFRVDGDCSLDILVNTVSDTFNLQDMLAPNLMYKGQNINMLDTVSMYPAKALFILLNGFEVPREMAGHQGKVWQCLACGVSVNDRDHLRKVKTCQHNLMFEGLIPKSWGKNHDRHLRPWGCPAGHGSAQPQVSHEVGGPPSHVQGGQPAASQPSSR